ncbi:hypothetical protein ACJMK2_005474 [Sinanodonta woodiana]|uniref:Uncharacterized protein n=1 Tax=Sinanodonta woodiana TaxID=1069815 RepID=A0ABD3VQ65_SINWO
MATASNITDSLVDNINALPVTEDRRLELLQCISHISISDPDLYVNITDALKTAGNIKCLPNSKDIILMSVHYAGVINIILQKVLPPHAGYILNVGMLFFQPLFRTTGINRNIAAKVIDGLQHILDDDMKHECEGIKNEIWDSVAYLTGVPPANEVSETDKISILCGLGSSLKDLGSKQLGIIRSKVQDMVRKCSTGKFEVFLNYVELYCSLTILRELVLLYHVSVLSAYSAANATCVQNILDHHRDNDQSFCKVLSFLQKPRKDNLLWHLKYNANKREIIQSFLDKYKLQEDPNRFYDKALQIFSEKYKNATLSSHRILGLNRIRCYTNTNMENTVFQFRKTSQEPESMFSIHPFRWLYQHVSSGWWWLTATKGEPSERGKWRLVEIEPDEPNLPSSFVIVLESTEDECIYTDSLGYVYSKRLNGADSGFFWTLHVL